MDINKENLTECEKRVLSALERLKPFGRIEIAMNQNGKEISIYLLNPQKEVIKIES